MRTSIQRAPTQGAKRARLRARDLERQLRRFPAEVRPYAARAAGIDPALADLVIAFPALVIALAMPRRGFDARPVIARAIAGAPLGVLAKDAGVAMWLRKLPPEAFNGPIQNIPEGDLFARQIGNFLPKRTRDAAEWLRVIAFATQVAHEPFALWVAKSLRGAGKCPDRLQLVALWAWHSQQPGTTAGALIRRRWTPAMRYEHALSAARCWLENVDVHMAFAGSAPMDAWLKPGVFDDFEFLPVLTAAELMAEAADMKHCVRSYCESIVEQNCQIWSVRRGGKRVATIDLSAQQGQILLGIGQLRARQNKAVAVQVAVAVRNWLNAHTVEQLQPVRKAVERPLQKRQAWQRLWKPYWLDKGRVPYWLLLKPLEYIYDLG